jgi:putative oxidoreductase
MESEMSNSSGWRSCGLTILRLVVGAIFLAHGSQKLFTYGLHGVSGMFGQLGIPIPAVSSVVVTLVEFLGGIALILGLMTRWAAALLAIDMAGAILLVHFKNGFFASKGGYEYPLTLLAASLALLLAGPGSVALDNLIGRK